MPKPYTVVAEIDPSFQRKTGVGCTINLASAVIIVVDAVLDVANARFVFCVRIRITEQIGQATLEGPAKWVEVVNESGRTCK